MITRYLRFIGKLHKIVEKNQEKFEINIEGSKLIPNTYNKFKFEYGAKIKKIYYINRLEKLSLMYESKYFRWKIFRN